MYEMFKKSSISELPETLQPSYLKLFRYVVKAQTDLGMKQFDLTILILHDIVFFRASILD